MSSHEDDIVALTPRMKDVSPEYAELLMLGNVLFHSGYFKDVQDQAQAVTKILFGRELGFSPIVSMSGIYIIEGKPALSGNLLAACIKRSGKYDYRVVRWDNTEAVLMFREKVDGQWDSLGEAAFNLDDAKRAGVLGKGNWGKYPKAMLFNRALSQGQRAYCPEVSACPLYVPEELGAEVNEGGEVTELPPSARPVPVTKEVIPVAPPKRAAAVTPVNSLLINGSEPSQKAADPPVALGIAYVDGQHQWAPPDVVKTVDELQVAAFNDAIAAEMPSKSGVDPDATIDLGRQRALYRTFRDAIPSEAVQKQADAFFRDYLKHRGFVGEDGKGSTKKIPLLMFEEVKRKAVAWAATLK